MRKLKRVMVLALTLAVVLSFSACGSFEMSIMKGAKKMQELESLHMDMTMDAGFNIGVMGQEIPIDVKATNSADVQTNPQRLLMEMEAEVMGEKQTIHLYVEQNGDKYTMADSFDGTNWVLDDTFSMDVSKFADMIDPKASVAVLAKYGSAFEKAGTENIMGYDTVRYDGVISSDDLMELADLLSIEELAGMGIDISEEELAELKNALKGPYNVPCSIWLESKSGMIIRYDIDLTEMMGIIIATALAEEIVGTEAEALGIEIKVNNMKVSTVFSQFDEIGEIQRPVF